MVALGEAIDFILATYWCRLNVCRAFNFNCLKRIKSIPLCEKCFRCLSFSFYVTFITGTLPVSIEKLTDNVGLDNGTATFTLEV